MADHPVPPASEAWFLASPPSGPDPTPADWRSSANHLSVTMAERGWLVIAVRAGNASLTVRVTAAEADAIAGTIANAVARVVERDGDLYGAYDAVWPPEDGDG